jgi:hypothetical protein
MQGKYSDKYIMKDKQEKWQVFTSIEMRIDA